MRLIDGKGKIFGLVNIIDFVVMILVVLVAASSLIFWHSRQMDIKAENNPIRMYKYVRAKAYVVAEVADRIKKGDRSNTDKAGSSAMEVVDVVSNNPALVANVAETGSVKQVVPGKQEKAYYLNLPYSHNYVALGKTITPIDVGIELPSLRVVEIIAKVLCSYRRDGALISLLDNSTLCIGKNFSISEKDYTAIFTVTDILEEDYHAPNR